MDRAGGHTGAEHESGLRTRLMMASVSCCSLKKIEKHLNGSGFQTNLMEFFMRNGENENRDDTIEQSAAEEPGQQIADENNDVESLKQALAEAQAKVDDYWQRVLRAEADQDNTRKRAARDVESAHKYALEKFVSDLLPVVDSLEMGLVAAIENAEAEKIREGMELTLKMLLDVLKKYGVEQLDPLGEPFDPQLHQAMSTQPTSEVPPNTVTAVMQKGYTLNERLVRPAMVMVASKG